MNPKLLFKLLIVGVLAAMPALLFVGPDHSWFKAQETKAAQISAKKSHMLRIQKTFLCAREVLWYESRSDNEAGKRAVASVVLNRVQSKRFPNDICSVVQQYKQFSYRNSLKNRTKILVPIPKAAEWSKNDLINRIAYEIASGSFKRTLPPSVLWYHTHSVNPVWNTRMHRVTVDGSKHIFLKGSDRG